MILHMRKILKWLNKRIIVGIILMLIIGIPLLINTWIINTCYKSFINETAIDTVRISFENDKGKTIELIRNEREFVNRVIKLIKSGTSEVIKKRKIYDYTVQVVLTTNRGKEYIFDLFYDKNEKEIPFVFRKKGFSSKTGKVIDEDGIIKLIIEGAIIKK